jgi:hypothetical protein
MASSGWLREQQTSYEAQTSSPRSVQLGRRILIGALTAQRFSARFSLRKEACERKYPRIAEMLA